MNLKPTPEENKFRSELREWLAANLPRPFEGNRLRKKAPTLNT
jgi:hypothetical protein